MRNHRIEIRVLCVPQKAKHWGKGIESEDIEGGGFRERILRVQVYQRWNRSGFFLTGTGAGRIN